MFVVTTGRGNIDLSVASVMTLSAFVALLTSRARMPSRIGVAAAILLGLAIGALNSLLVVGLGIPAHHPRRWRALRAGDRDAAVDRAIAGFAVSRR